MFCKFCGNEMDDGAKFCAKCGGIAPESEAHTADDAYVPEIILDPITEEARESCAKKSLVLGIISLAIGSVPGFILALVGKNQVKKYEYLNGGVVNGKAKVGKILTTIGIPYGILTFVYHIITIVGVIASVL